MQTIAHSLLRWMEQESPCFENVRSLLHDIGVPGSLNVDIVHGPGKSFGTIELGGYDLAQLSDGTLRVLEIACRLVDPDVKVLILDEPETSLHPAMLHRLLAEIKAASLSKQIILSTHSPEVVSSFKPSAIRLIRWTDKGPEIRSIEDEQMPLVHAFLEDEGSLGEYIFEGGLEE